jgi:hypothetical protein
MAIPTDPSYPWDGARLSPDGFLVSTYYKDLRYLLLKAQRMAATKTEYATFRKAA